MEPFLAARTGARTSRAGVARAAARLVLLKVDGERRLLQRVRDLRRAQALGVDLLAQQAQRLQVHVELVGGFVPDAVGHAPELRALALDLRVLVGVRQHRAGRAAAERALRVVVAGVGLQQQVVGAARLPAARQHVVHQEVVRHVHPARAVGAEGLAVHKDRRLPAGAQVHGDALAPRRLRQHDARAHPAVFIAAAPELAGVHGLEVPALRRLRGRELVHGQKPFHGDGAQGLVEVLLQREEPVLQALPPLRVHVLHGKSPSFLSASGRGGETKRYIISYRNHVLRSIILCVAEKSNAFSAARAPNPKLRAMEKLDRTDCG